MFKQYFYSSTDENEMKMKFFVSVINLDRKSWTQTTIHFFVIWNICTIQNDWTNEKDLND